MGSHFPTFEPILNFMYAFEYVDAAAVLCHGSDDKAAWNCYVKWAQACWSGNVESVIPELMAWLQSRGLDPTAPRDDPQKAAWEVLQFLALLAM